MHVFPWTATYLTLSLSLYRKGKMLVNKVVEEAGGAVSMPVSMVNVSDIATLLVTGISQHTCTTTCESSAASERVSIMKSPLVVCSVSYGMVDV